VTSAHPLSDDQLAALKTKLTAREGRTVEDANARQVWPQTVVRQRDLAAEAVADDALDRER